MSVRLLLLSAVLTAPTLAQAQSVTALPVLAGPAATGDRAGENAVRQAGDAFGTVVGREEIGLYNADEVRGFSPIVAGNVRFDGLYFDSVWLPGQRLRTTSTIRVGLSALGSPFPAPTGIVDYGFRTPGDAPGVSLLFSIDAWGNRTAEIDAVLPLSGRFSLGMGGAVSGEEFYNGTRSQFQQASLSARWDVTERLKLRPYFLISQGVDETGPVYLPAGNILPPRLPRRQFFGPTWPRYRGVAINGGMLADWQLDEQTEVRAGLFRSLFDDARSFAHLVTDVAPDGSGNRLIIADPPLYFASTSGEIRLTRTLADGPRRHRFHATLRGRSAFRRFDGSAFIDLGPTTITRPEARPAPDYAFGPQQRDRVRQLSYGLAYEGAWTGVGELSIGVQRSHYAKRIGLPTLPAVATDATPVLINVAGGVTVTPGVTLYGGFVTGLEESGIAPDNAVNRNEALPAIRTRQVDFGARWQLGRLRVIIGGFEVRKPYLNLDPAGRFGPLGDVVNRGLEVSLSGPITSGLSLVAGVVLLDPQVTGDAVVRGLTGPRPVGAIRRRVEAGADWRPGFAPGLSFDVNVSSASSQVATVNNLVHIPARTIVDFGGRYAFKLARQPAVLRVTWGNVGDFQGWELRGAGAYDLIPGRLLAGYLTLDF